MTYMEATNRFERRRQILLGIRKTSWLSMEMRTSGMFRTVGNAECPLLTIRRQVSGILR
jgi:hypothetical protein